MINKNGAKNQSTNRWIANHFCVFFLFYRETWFFNFFSNSFGLRCYAVVDTESDSLRLFMIFQNQTMDMIFTYKVLDEIRQTPQTQPVFQRNFVASVGSVSQFFFSFWRWVFSHSTILTSIRLIWFCFLIALYINILKQKKYQLNEILLLHSTHYKDQNPKT